MVATNNTRNSEVARWALRQSEDAQMAIHSGLSVTVAGHFVTVLRDESTRVAKLTVTKLKNGEATQVELDAVKVAAELLLRRARRTLVGWTVLGVREAMTKRVPGPTENN